jgi:DNA-binding PadR family transcriptional regulator
MSNAPIDFNGLDSAVYGPVRLGVLTALQVDGALDFTTLKKRLDVADGAIGIHLRKLEEIKYISCHKAFVGRRPKSTYKITAGGRRALRKYLSTMQQLIDSLEKDS